MPDPIIKKPNQHFNATLYTGTGSAGSVTGTGFQPDFLWVKKRSATENHALYDVVRGAGKRIESSTTSAEDAESGGMSGFISDGFSISGASDRVNTNAATYVAWQWKAGGASTVNTSGTISSNVSVNTTAGFSVVTYTGNGTNGATIGHGLGVAPKWVIVKNRGSSVDDWLHYHTSLGATKSIAFDTNAAVTSSTRWNNTAPSSTVITLGTSTGVNASSNTYVAYCWAEVEGYSKFGSYTGNGSTDGPFVYLGFRPKFILAKRTDTAGFDWILTDSSRSPSNVVDKRLFGNTIDAESSATTPYDYLSNGFKLRNTNTNENASGGTYIFMAFAEAPFKYSNAR
jgi:hypothetical protein